jgi:hypothetical protein
MSIVFNFTMHDEAGEWHDSSDDFTTLDAAEDAARAWVLLNPLQSAVVIMTKPIYTIKATITLKTALN